MSRFVVIREEEAGERLVEESAVPSEAVLHQVLMRHPELVPATDLGFGRVATVGYEAGLSSGSADLVLLDDAGRLGIVEVKKEGNPDTRRVIAQLLDYAAALWGLTVEEFDEAIVQKQAGTQPPRTLREIVTKQLVSDADEPEEEADKVLDGLGETLRSGDFALVLAAPTVPHGVAQVIEYLNARGLSVFGLEVSYFAGEVEAFVPRLVMRPSIGGRIAGRDPKPSKGPVDPEDFFSRIPESAARLVKSFLQEMPRLGGEVEWKNYGPRVRVRGEAGPKVVVTFDQNAMWITASPRKGLNTDVIRHASEEFDRIASSRIGPDLGSLRWESGSDGEVGSALDVVRELVKRIVADRA